MSLHDPPAARSSDAAPCELPAEAEEAPTRQIIAAGLRSMCERILGDARIWFLPVIAACAWCRDERVFIALPLVMGLVFVFLLHRQARNAGDRPNA